MAPPGAILQGFVARLLQRARLEAPVLPGEWRRQQLRTGAALTSTTFRLFTSILVPISGRASGWSAFDEALDVAAQEHGRLLGLHVTQDEAGRAGEQALQVCAEFERRCLEAGVAGRLAIVSGDVARTIGERSRWVDLTVLGLSYPPPEKAWARLGSGFRALLGASHSPLLAVPAHGVRALGQVLLAYNSGPHGPSCLFMAGYLAARWRLALTVLSVRESGFDTGAALGEAATFLRVHGVVADFLAREGPECRVARSRRLQPPRHGRGDP
jgi:nucleotide-binding universal stress UspA family protein